MRTTLILSDVQYPYHDKVALKKFIDVARDIQPDHIVSIGDLIDHPSVSRWSKGNAGEYAGTLQKDIDGTVSEILRPLREACSESKFTWVRGNHCARIEDFVKKWAAPLGTLRALEVPALFGLDELAINYVHGPHRIAPNTHAIHGHEAGSYSSTPSAWDTKLTKRYGSDKSFVMGHTHQGFLINRATGFKGKVTPRFTMNVGSIMDPNHATYVPDGAVNWVMSFGLIHDDGKRVYPELVTMNDRGFFLNGRKY